MPQLATLDLTHSQLTGIVPESYSGLSTLHLAHNDLTGNVNICQVLHASFHLAKPLLVTTNTAFEFDPKLEMLDTMVPLPALSSNPYDLQCAPGFDVGNTTGSEYHYCRLPDEWIGNDISVICRWVNSMERDTVARLTVQNDWRENCRTKSPLDYFEGVTATGSGYSARIISLVLDVAATSGMRNGAELNNRSFLNSCLGHRLSISLSPTTLRPGLLLPRYIGELTALSWIVYLYNE